MNSFLLSPTVPSNFTISLMLHQLQIQSLYNQSNSYSYLKNKMTHLNFSFFFFLLSFIISSSSSSSSSNMSVDFYPLQSFKSSSDPAGVLSSWSPATGPCSGSWLGISCHNGRVTHLVLEGLNLNGSMKPLALLPRLTVLSLKNNSISDSLHLLNLSLWQPHLKLLYLSDNRFSGPFPACVALLRHLRRLDLAGNLLSGRIPASIGVLLPRLLTLRLERNFFEGEIPGSLGAIRGLIDVNVSHNHLVGEIPTNLSSFPFSSYVGNLGLCGEPLPRERACLKRALPSLSSSTSSSNNKRKKNKKKKKKTKHRGLILFSVVILTAAAALAMLTAAFMILKRRRSNRRKGDNGKDAKEERMVFFDGCGEFAVEELMRGSAEMLGRGVVGSTYRVVLEGGGVAVVVKRIKKERLMGKWVEAERLLREVGRWRHPNVVSLLGYFSSEEELLLLFEHAPMGSLHNLLHGNRGPGRTPLDWATRIKIALGAAKGLSFLHESSKSNISHQHLTSSNILIAEDGNALISDFAIHQLLPPPPPPPPPLDSSAQDTAKRDSLKCDVYGFGTVLLEILTGRTQGEGGMDLVKWVQMVEEWSFEVFDFELLRCKQMEDEMAALLQVALLCLTPDAQQRPKMTTVVKMIEDINKRGYNL